MKLRISLMLAPWTVAAMAAKSQAARVIRQRRLRRRGSPRGDSGGDAGVAVVLARVQLSLLRPEREWNVYQRCRQSTSAPRTGDGPEEA
jgi:hypothetical protein